MIAGETVSTLLTCDDMYSKVENTPPLPLPALIMDRVLNISRFTAAVGVCETMADTKVGTVTVGSAELS